MKSILQKTEAQNQTNLMRHITSLLLVVNSIDDKKLALNSHEESTCPELQSIETLTSKTIRFRDYQGQSELAYLPVLCFFPVLGSILSSEIQASYAQAGIRLIILEEAEDTPSSYKSKPEYFEQLMQAYLAIIDYLKLPKVSLLGHCAGGVYAIEFAKRFSERCTAVFCVDTGAPLRTKEQWNAVSATAKRTFMVAKSFPSVLFMPHRLVAQRFFSGDKGQQKTVEYFYNDCKNDLAILANDTAVKRWSLDMLTFCFNDIKRPIRACEIWVQDWSGALAEVSKTTPVCFIHGDNNPQFRLCDIVEMTQMHENIFLRVAKGAQQLTFVTHLELIQASLVKPTSFLT
jgi:pimeloyl-ACP methyl ester carboxylesterase